MGNTVEPLSIMCATGLPSEVITTVKIGSEGHYFSAKSADYWALFFDRTTLKLVLEEAFSDNSTVPASLAKHATDDNLIMVICTSQLSIQSVPHGPLAQFLYDQGAGIELTKIQQLATMFGTGNFRPAAYIFVAVPNDRATHFEWSNTGSDYLAAALSLNTFGTTRYTPTALEIV